MNKHDSERIAGTLENVGFMPHDNVDNEIDLVIFNTCCVREKADNRLYGNALKLANLKKKNSNFLLAIGGCLAQKEAIAIKDKIPEVDIIFGTSNIASLPELIEKASVSKGTIINTDFDTDPPVTSLPSKRDSQISAWIPISTGCNNYCTYCVVPYVRGKEKSRPLQEIVSDVESLADDGVKEITLLGQNVNSYGLDLGHKDYFSQLLSYLNEIKYLERIRFITSHPKDLTDKVIETVKNCNKICEHFHLPIQAGSDNILKSMNRGYTQNDYLKLISKIKSKIPESAITTDIMVGFPGETESDFQETLKVVEFARFDQAYTFIYSHRSGTKAANLNDQIEDEVKTDRFQRLIKLQNQISAEINKGLINHKVDILVEGRSRKNKNLLSGRTRTNKIVHFPGPNKLIHQLVSVIIKESLTWYLNGVVANNE